MVLSDFLNFFMLIISNLVINPLFVIFYSFFLVYLIFLLISRLLRRC